MEHAHAMTADADDHHHHHHDHHQDNGHAGSHTDHGPNVGMTDSQPASETQHSHPCHCPSAASPMMVATSAVELETEGLSEGDAQLSMAVAALPLGSLRYPLLRPPSAVV
jgi:hypothetical protein